MIETNVYDETNRKRTTIDYADLGAISDIREYDAPPNTSTVLRRTHYDYLRGTAYIDHLNRRMTQLVSKVYVYDGSGNPHSKVTYGYDLGGEYQVHQGPPVQHDTANYGTGFVQGRGNLNEIRRWDVTEPENEAKSMVSKAGHNTSGSLIWSRDAAGHQANFIYTDSFSDGVNRNALAYVTKMTDPDNYASMAQYKFEIGAVTRTEDPKSAALVHTYDAAGRLERTTNQVNNAYTRYVYALDQSSVQSFTTIKGLTSEFYQITVFDGHDRVRAVGADHPASSGSYKAQYSEYDVMGRQWRQTNMTEVTEAMVATGDDAAGFAWSSQADDWKSRPTVLTNQDQTTSEISYDGCGCTGSQMITVVDEVGRRKDQTFDILGRVVRERTYNWGGSNGGNVYSTTTNTYNVRDQITNIRILDNASDVSQNTVMTYDGHGRLKTRQLPIYLGNPQSATPDTNYEYNADDTLKKQTDPRGASATYGYNGRHLVTGITYGAPSGVATTPNVTFDYDQAGNRTRMDDGPGLVTYSYDTLSRMTSETRVFDSISRYILQGSGQPYQSTFTIGYSYNLGNMVTQITTPTGDAIDYAYDQAGRTTKVSGTPRDGVTDYITDIKYRAWDAAKQVSYGYSNYSITAQFNSRMLISRVDDQRAFGAAFGYDLDGRIKTVEGLYGPARTLDRSLSYDHVGRLTQTRSGAAAGLGGTEPEQLRQNYTNDAFNQMSTRSGGYWYQGPNFDNVFSATYTNGRGTNVKWKQVAENWQYDIAGNIKSDTDIAANVHHANLDWNAPGKMVKDSHPVINDTYGHVR